MPEREINDLFSTLLMNKGLAKEFLNQETRKEALGRIASSPDDTLSKVKTSVELTEEEANALMGIPSAESLRDIAEYFADYDKLMAGHL